MTGLDALLAQQLLSLRSQIDAILTTIQLREDVSQEAAAVEEELPKLPNLPPVFGRNSTGTG